ncbi:C40 family peptidase [Acidithiobacillus caldus]
MQKKSRWHILLATAVLLGGSALAQAATTSAAHGAHPRTHSSAQHHPGKVAAHKVAAKKESRATALRKRSAVRGAHHRVTTHRKVAAHVPSVRPGEYRSSEEKASAPANYDSLMPTALELMGMSPVEFAGVGAAPQQPEFRPYRIVPLPTRAASVTAPSFIDQSLVLAKTGVAPIVPMPVTAEASAEVAASAAAIPAVAQDAPNGERPQGPEAPTSQLGLALEMLASQAYHWARHPLMALEASGDAAVGRQGVANLAADLAEAADAGGSSGDGSWLSPRSLVRSALKFIGAPYRWGGMSPVSGFDCSGFVKFVLAKFDIEVPRTSYAQAAALPRIPRSDLKPGDLVFFNTMHRAYSHVGIYIGHGRFVSAQTPSSGVQVASLNDPYWAARFDGARRIPGTAHPS